MSIATRRTFILRAAAAGCALGCVRGPAGAQTAKLDEADPQAVALGYKHDTTKVDAKKYPKHATTQACANCQLYQAKPTDAWGPCPLFSGKQVAAKGWCSAWVQKSA